MNEESREAVHDMVIEIKAAVEDMRKIYAEEDGHRKELFGALAKAQAKLKAVPFDSKNPHFNNEFASLTAIQEATRGPLAEQGLSIIQLMQTRGADMWLITMLCHSSGQAVRSEIKLVTGRNDMQSIGSATTYAKRYAWQALCGVSGDQDDDGNAAVGNPGNAQQTRPQQNSKPEGRPANQTTVKEKPQNVKGKPPVNQAPASDVDRKKIFSILELREMSLGVFQAWIKAAYGTDKVLAANVKSIIGVIESEHTTEATLMAEVARYEKERSVEAPSDKALAPPSGRKA